METKLGSWSWQALHTAYYYLGSQLREYHDIADRFELQLPLEDLKALKDGQVVPYENDQQREFIIWFVTDVLRINNELKLLDQEIARRNKLIGVI